MRAVVQRVSRAAVSVEGETVGEIGPGMAVLLGVGADDGEQQARRMAGKLSRLRIFDDERGRMNEPPDGRGILCVSQFTLYADTRKGNRPSFTGAAPGEAAEPLYDLVCDLVGAQRGVFGARMTIEMVADGPVTVQLEV